jgi:Peptidogalycan biosysnthesis/recognition
VNPVVRVIEGLSAWWPALAVDAPMLATPGWLRAMDGRLGARPLTFEVWSDDRVELAAFASVQTTSRPGEFFDLHHILVRPTPDFPLTEQSRAAREALSRTAPDDWLPSLVVMLPGYECVPVGPGSTDPAALAALVTGALDWAAEHDIPTVAFLYLRPTRLALADALREQGFTRLPLTYTWDLHLPGDGIEDYLAALPRKRRKETRREARMLAESGVDIRPVAVEPVFDELVALRCQLVTKYRGRADHAHEAARLRTMIEDVAGGDPTLLLATADDTPVGFALFAPNRDEWLCLAVGHDYADPRSRLTYFGAAYYRAAETAYAVGVRTLGYGQGSWQAKRARGCAPTLMAGWVHSTDPALAATVRASAEVTELVSLD